MLTEFPAVVAPQHNDRFFSQPQAVELTQQTAHLCIDERHGGIITMFQLALIRHGQRTLKWRRHMAIVHVVAQLVESAHRSVTKGHCRCAARKIAVRRELDFRRIIEIPVLRRHNKRQVWTDETGGEEKGLILAREFAHGRDCLIRHRAIEMLTVFNVHTLRAE